MKIAVWTHSCDLFTCKLLWRNGNESFSLTKRLRVQIFVSANCFFFLHSSILYTTMKLFITLLENVNKSCTSARSISFNVSNELQCVTECVQEMARPMALVQCCCCCPLMECWSLTTWPTTTPRPPPSPHPLSLSLLKELAHLWQVRDNICGL
jgi:hypothetical protein